MTTPAIPLSEELDTIGKRIIWIIEKFGDRYPGLHESYRLIELLYFREYVIDEWMRTTFDVLIRRAAEGDERIPNPLSIHRSQTIVKKLFQDEKDRVRSDEKEAEWHAVLVPDPVEWREGP